LTIGLPVIWREIGVDFMLHLQIAHTLNAALQEGLQLRISDLGGWPKAVLLAVLIGRNY